MDDNLRAEAVSALVRLSEGSDYRDRAAAGIGLASFAGIPTADVALHRLVLDAENTFVTSETTYSLARLAEPAGIAVVASALSRADDNGADWIASGLDDALTFDPSGLDRAIAACKEMQPVSGPDLSRGYDRLLELLLPMRRALNP